jgi:choline-glycine betaine transporter
MLSSRGALEPKPGVVVLWGVLAGASAAVLLLMGGLQGLQTASIIAAAPFLVVMVGLCISLWHSLLDELEEGKARRPLPTSAMPGAGTVDASPLAPEAVP